jgi:hypothetical protein
MYPPKSLAVHASPTLPALESTTAGLVAEDPTPHRKSHRAILADDRSDALAAQSTGQKLWLASVDDLDAVDESRMLEQVDQGAIEG